MQYLLRMRNEKAMFLKTLVRPGEVVCSSGVEHVEQYHIWGDKTRAACLTFVRLCINKQNHL